MRLLNFRKTTPRTFFTAIFGSVGKRRTVFFGKPFGGNKRTKMQMIRRAHQGWRNKRIGTIEAIKVRLRYGRHKPIPQFRR